MNTHWRNHLLERLERGDSLEQIDRDLRRIGGLSEEERDALWLLAWGEQQQRAPARRAAADELGSFDWCWRFRQGPSLRERP